MFDIHNDLILPGLPLLAALLGLVSNAHGADIPPKPWECRPTEGERVVIDPAGGAIVEWTKGSDTFIRQGAGATAFVFRLAKGEEATFVIEKATPEEKHLRLEGYLEKGAFRLPVDLSYRVEPGKIHVAIEPKAPKPLPAALEAWSWRLPLALDWRKQIYFCGEYHFEWETRYFYQFLFQGRQLLTSPDRNEWRYFGADQITPRAFRLWKAESGTTSPLVMQEGRRLAPFVQLFDRQKGVALEYPQLGEAGNRGLHVDAAGGATVEVRLWQRDAATDRPPASLFTRRQEITLHATSGDADLLAQRADLQQRYPSEERPDPEKILEESALLRTTATPTGKRYVAGGWPFAQGVQTADAPFALRVGGKEVPLQSRPLAWWPDGSVKWMQVIFPLPDEKGGGTTTGPRVTFRNADPLPVEPGKKSAPVTDPITITRDQNGVEVRTGSFAARFAEGAAWLKLFQKGRPLLREDAAARLAYVDYQIAPDRLFPSAPEPEGGTTVRETLEITSLTVEEEGPLRAVIRLEGMAGEATRIILRATLHAGRPEIALTHTAEFLFKDPRETFLIGMGLELPLAGARRFRFADAPREATALLQSTQVARRALLPDGEAVAVEGESGTLRADLPHGYRFHGIIRNFTRSAPKALSAEGGNVRLELWPLQAGPMDVRRYSNFPHRSQGEAVSDEASWVEEVYYPNDPFVGVSRTHEMLLGFWPAKEAGEIASHAADFQSPPLLYAGWDYYVAAQVPLPTPAQADWPKAWEAWTRLTRFWLYHQRLYRWHGFWDDGDFRHHFRGGYGMITTPEGLEATFKNAERQLPESFPLVHDYRTSGDWAYDNGRWGWSNSEGLANLFLKNEYLRHGNRAVYFAAEAMARFCRDVVVRHDGQWLGKGTRHGVQHWSDGNHEERQTTTTEYRLHYFLSGGEGRTREVIEKLYEVAYSQIPVHVEANHSGRWGGLFFHQELTGDPEEAEQLRRYAQAFASPKGLYLNPHVNFPGATVLEPPSNLNGASFFFQHYGAMAYLLEYQRAFADEELTTAFLAFADAILAEGEIPRSRLIDLTAPVAFAAIHAPNPEPYRAYLLRHLRGEGWKALYQSVSADPSRWSGPGSFVELHIPGVFFWNNWAPYLTAGLGRDTVWDEAIATALREPAPALPPGLRAPQWGAQEALDRATGAAADYLQSHRPATGSAQEPGGKE